MTVVVGAGYVGESPDGKDGGVGDYEYEVDADGEAVDGV